MGRNPYAHICSLIKDKFNCSYKDVPDDSVDNLRDLYWKYKNENELGRSLYFKEEIL